MSCPVCKSESHDYPGYNSVFCITEIMNHLNNLDIALVKLTAALKELSLCIHELVSSPTGYRDA
jgi:hypothetical protein